MNTTNKILSFFILYLVVLKVVDISYHYNIASHHSRVQILEFTTRDTKNNITIRILK